MQSDDAADVARAAGDEEFLVDGKTYYFTPGGFLYRKDPGSEELGGFFCGYLADEVWRYSTDDG